MRAAAGEARGFAGGGEGMSGVSIPAKKVKTGGRYPADDRQNGRQQPPFNLNIIIPGKGEQKATYLGPAAQLCRACHS